MKIAAHNSNNFYRAVENFINCSYTTHEGGNLTIRIELNSRKTINDLVYLVFGHLTNMNANNKSKKKLFSLFNWNIYISVIEMMIFLEWCACGTKIINIKSYEGKAFIALCELDVMICVTITVASLISYVFFFDFAVICFFFAPFIC